MEHYTKWITWLMFLATTTIPAVVLAGISPNEFPYLLPTKLQTVVNSDEQKQAAESVIQTFLDEWTRGLIRVTQIDFGLFQDEKDTFILTTMELGDGRRRLNIQASSGVAAVWGFHHYIKQYCDCHIGWQTRRIVYPNPLPHVNETIVANDRFRYYGNVCTQSYSSPWWGAQEWTSHVHWMALNGINLVLAPLRQELVWRTVYRNLGLTEDEISEHFAGPAFLAWQHMGNLRGWGGPLSSFWFDSANEAQNAIVKTMQALGMIPVLPAFAGHVPRAITRIFPNATFVETKTWNNFSSDYCCPMFVHPRDPLFRRIGKSFLQETIRLDGNTHIYSADPFNELETSLWSDNFVKQVSQEIFSTMTSVDPSAVWLVQNWMFVHDPELWPTERVRAFLNATPLGRLLVLDLQSEQWPQYNIHNMYYGQPFVWCMLHNFGGTLGMFGDLRPINFDVYATRELENSTMLGVGLTMEGINQNYVVYDLMLESAWRKCPVEDLNAWAAVYARRRYGCNATSRAWRYLLRSVYSYPGVVRMRGKYVVTRRPSLRIVPWAWYRSYDLIEAWKEFVGASQYCSGPGFEHDLVDLTRQVLQYRAEQLYVRVVDNFRANNLWPAQRAIESFLDVMEDMEKILRTNDDFSLWKWIESARMSTGIEDENLNDINARNQITLWGPNGEIEDYACKQWAGMMQYYYIPRWRQFLSAAVATIPHHLPILWDERPVQEVVRESVTQNFAVARQESYPRGSSVQTARILLRKWAVVPGVRDLPHLRHQQRVFSDGSTFSDTSDFDSPSVILISSTPSDS